MKLDIPLGILAARILFNNVNEAPNIWHDARPGPDVCHSLARRGIQTDACVGHPANLLALAPFELFNSPFCEFGHVARGRVMTSLHHGSAVQLWWGQGRVLAASDVDPVQ